MALFPYLIQGQSFTPATCSSASSRVHARSARSFPLNAEFLQVVVVVNVWNTSKITTTTMRHTTFLASIASSWSTFSRALVSFFLNKRNLVKRDSILLGAHLKPNP
jgi:hypothetical protein